MNKHEDRHIDIIFGNYAEVSGDSVRDFNFHYKSGSSGEDFLFWKWAIFVHPPSAYVKSDRRFLFPEFLNKHQDWGFGQCHQFGRACGATPVEGVLDVGRYGRMTAKQSGGQRSLYQYLPQSAIGISAGSPANTCWPRCIRRTPRRSIITRRASCGAAERQVQDDQMVWRLSGAVGVVLGWRPAAAQYVRQGFRR